MLDSTAAAGLSRATPPASPRYRAADDVTVKMNCIEAISQYSVNTSINPKP